MKFSVLIPTRDRLDLLQLAVQSVLQQDFDSFELIVSDNCSAEPVRPWLESLEDSRVKLVEQKSPVPVTANWNRALNEATGDYVIMLGDDDALLPDYFQSMSDIVEQFEAPDCIYHGAYLFTYPGVIPGRKEGLLHESRNALFWRDGRSTYLLDQALRLQLVSDSLKLKNSFGFNMQFALLKRSLIRQLACDQDFYQSPYPDYYAMNLVMLRANTVLVREEPAVAIGVSPRSFGWYFQNKQEDSGNTHLGIDESELEAFGVDDSVYLPGTSMNTHWLIAMFMLRAQIGASESMPVPSIKNFRRKQIIYFCLLIAHEQVTPTEIAEFPDKLATGERLLFQTLRAVARCGKPGMYTLSKLHTLSQKTAAYMLRLLTRNIFTQSSVWKVEPQNTILDIPQLTGNS